MNFKKYNKNYNTIQTALLDNEIHKAHTLLEQFIVDYAPDMDTTSASLQQLEQAMDTLFESKAQSSMTLSDQMDQIYADTWLLLDQIHWSVIEHKPMIFAVDDLEAELAPARIASCDDVRLGCVFNTLRTTYPVTKTLRSALHECILSDEVPMFKRATLLSAVTLNVLEWFDADLLECMYTYTLDDQPSQLRQQSWTALCLCGMVHDTRIMHHPRLREEYLLLCEEEPEQLRLLQKFILPLREHGSFDRKFKQLLGNMFTKAFKRSQEMKDDEEEENEFRPKEEMLDQKDKQDIMSLVDLLHSSLDSGYNGFRKLCQTPFFQREGNEHHWLMPFSSEQEDVRRVLSEQPSLATWINVMKANLAQTNTDKYGALVLMASMPESANASFLSKLSELDIEADKLKELSGDMLMMIYLQDFFRFFTLSPVGKKMRNPFDLSPDLSTYLCFGKSLHTAENLRVVSAFLTNSQRWTEAIDTLYRLIDKEFTLENVLALIASYYQIDREKWDKRFTAVVERAFLLYPNDSRIMDTMIDVCDTQDPRCEVNLRELVKQAPDNIYYLYKLGVLLNNLGRYTEALEPLYKCHVLDEKDLSVMAELLKAHFFLGQFEKAVSMRDKLLEDEYNIPDDDPLTKPDVIVLVALLYLYEGKVDRSYKTLDAGIETDAYYREAHQSLNRYERMLARRGLHLPVFAICKEQLRKLQA